MRISLTSRGLLAASGLLVLSACARDNPLYCADSSECTDPAKPYCDILGIYPAARGLNNYCIPTPSDRRDGGGADRNDAGGVDGRDGAGVVDGDSGAGDGSDGGGADGADAGDVDGRDGGLVDGRDGNDVDGDDGGVERKLLKGEACAGGDTCLKGACVDGVCCDTACGGQCEACDVEGHVGDCSPVVGPSRGERPACGGDTTPCAGSCDGANRAACSYPTGSCSVPKCSGGQLFAAGKCNAGDCQVPPPSACETGDCDGDACLTVTQVACGGSDSSLIGGSPDRGGFCCALMSDRTVRCWGANAQGQLAQGPGNLSDSHRPIAVPGLSNVLALAASGHAFACAMLGDHTVRCWGRNHYGQLGRKVVAADLTVPHPTPEPVIGVSGVRKISLGLGHACALYDGQVDGRIKCWGWNFRGQVGNGDPAAEPADVPLATEVCRAGMPGRCNPLQGATDIAVTLVSSCAILDDAPYCWGSNEGGILQATPDTGLVTSLPKRLEPRTGVTALGDCGSSSVISLLKGGELWSWGYNLWGQVANGVAGGDVIVPSHACGDSGCAAHVTDVSAVTQGGTSGCAIRAGGALSCWGSEPLGLEGVASQAFLGEPTIDSGVVQVSAGGQHACAVLSTGGVRCWGSNANGELGNDDTLPQDTPISPHW